MQCLQNFELERLIAPNPDTAMQLENAIFYLKLTGAFGWVTSALAKELLGLGVHFVAELNFFQPKR
jgi:hypothetical protein